MLAVFKSPFKLLSYTFFHMVAPEPNSIGSRVLYNETVQSKWYQNDCVSQPVLQTNGEAGTLN